MEYIQNIINPLIDKIELLGKTQLEIYKYRVMLKSSTLIASLIYLFMISFFLLLMAITLNIAIAHWLGRLLENIVLGYIAVSIFYALIVFLIYTYRREIHTRIQNNILSKIQH